MPSQKERRRRSGANQEKNNRRIDGHMKREHRYTNIGNEVAKFTDPAMKYSEIRAKLGDLEQALHQTCRELNSV